MKIIGTDALYFNANFQALTQLIFLYNAERHATERGVEVEIDHKHPAVTLALILAWVGAGGEVEDYPCFIKFTPAAYAANVPDTVPGHSYVDADGNEITRTWAEWKLPNYKHEQFDGDTHYYVPSDAMTRIPLTGSELAIVEGLTGVNVLTEAEYKDARSDDGGV